MVMEVPEIPQREHGWWGSTGGVTGTGVVIQTDGHLSEGIAHRGDEGVCNIISCCCCSCSCRSSCRSSSCSSSSMGVGSGSGRGGGSDRVDGCGACVTKGHEGA